MAAALVGPGLGAPPASAARLTRVSVTLACDRGVSGAVNFVMETAEGAPIGGFSSQLVCGDAFHFPAHVRTAFAADLPEPASVSLTWGASTVEEGACPGTGGPLPFKGECADAGGSGIKVTVR